MLLCLAFECVQCDLVKVSSTPQPLQSLLLCLLPRITSKVFSRFYLILKNMFRLRINSLLLVHMYIYTCAQLLLYKCLPEKGFISGHLSWRQNWIFPSKPDLELSSFWSLSSKKNEKRGGVWLGRQDRWSDMLTWASDAWRIPMVGSSDTYCTLFYHTYVRASALYGK